MKAKKTECDKFPGCYWCNDIGKCRKKSLPEQERCSACSAINGGEQECKNGGCIWCDKLEICVNTGASCDCKDYIDECDSLAKCKKCGPAICQSIDSECTACDDLNADSCTDHFVNSSDRLCTKCGSVDKQCSDSIENCPDCIGYKDQESCLASPKQCFWCGNSCQSSADSCSCDNLSEDDCANAIFKDEDEKFKHCTYCYVESTSASTSGKKCVKNKSNDKCDIECGTIESAAECKDNCIWCGKKCVSKAFGHCDDCSTYNNKNDCSEALQLDGDKLLYCQYCDEVENEGDNHCILSSQKCFVNCARIESEMGCNSQSNCIWCGAECVFKSKDTTASYFANCPSCNEYNNKYGCQHSVNECGWCNDKCQSRSDCISNTIAQVATISAGVIAAIAIGAFVFVALSVFGSKKVYDAIVLARESHMESTTSNPMYEKKDNGGENPLFSA